MTEQKVEEKRKHIRRLGETLVRFEGENFSIYSRATNISERGAFLRTHYLLEPGTRIQIHLIDPAGLETATPARVVRAMSDVSQRGEVSIGLGVEFENDPTKVS